MYINGLTLNTAFSLLLQVYGVDWNLNEKHLAPRLQLVQAAFI